MKFTSIQLACLAATLASGMAHADSNIQDVQQRNVNQEQRILDGLKSGALATGEAAKLEREQQQISLMQANSLKHGGMTADEKARVMAQQDRVSQLIREAEQNNWKGDPNSGSSRAMQEAVQRNLFQQTRIQQGIANGTLTNNELLELQQGQARIAALEASSGKGGLSQPEQARIDKARDAESARINAQVRDEQSSGGSPGGTRIQDVQQRNVFQEQRILDGLKSGALSPAEAARLEGEQQQISLIQANALKHGGMTADEKARVAAQQDRVGLLIRDAEQNDIKGDPKSAGSRAMQDAVQRNVNQQRRIQEGIANGTLTNSEVLTLQQGQARVAALEASSAKGGLSAQEQARIDNARDAESARIKDQRQDEQERGEASPK